MRGYRFFFIRLSNMNCITNKNAFELIHLLVFIFSEKSILLSAYMGIFGLIATICSGNFYIMLNMRSIDFNIKFCYNWFINLLRMILQ